MEIVNEGLWLQARDETDKGKDYLVRVLATYRKLGGKLDVKEEDSAKREYLVILKKQADNSENLDECRSILKEIKAVEEDLPDTEEVEVSSDEASGDEEPEKELNEDILTGTPEEEAKEPVLSEPPVEDIGEDVEAEPEERADAVKEVVLEFKGKISEVVKSIFNMELSDDELKALVQKMLKDITSYLGDVTNVRIEDLMGEDVVPLK